MGNLWRDVVIGVILALAIALAVLLMVGVTIYVADRQAHTQSR